MRLATAIVIGFWVGSVAGGASGQTARMRPDAFARWRAGFGKVAITILFDKNDSAVHGKDRLQAIAAFMKTAPDLDLEIEGNADSAEANPQSTAKSRADRVSAALRTLGVPTAQIVPVGESDRQPAEPPTSEQNRAKNRRVEIIPVPRGAPAIALPMGIKVTWGVGMTLSPDGRYALVGQNVPQLFDLAHGVRVKTLPGGFLPHFSPNGRWIAAVRSRPLNNGYRPELVIYDVFSGAPLSATVIPDSEGGVWMLAWSPDSTRVACTLRTSLVTLDVSGLSANEIKRTKILESATCLVWDPLDRFIAYSRRGTNDVFLVNPKTLKPFHAAEPVNYLHALAETSDGKYLAATDDTRTLTVWNTTNWKSRTMPIQELCAQMVPAPSGDRMLLNDFGGGDHEHVLLTDLAAMRPVAETAIPYDTTFGGYSADGKTIYAAYLSGWLCYSAKDLSRVPSLNPHTSAGYEIHVDSDRNSVTTLDGNGIQIWDAKTGERTHIVSGNFYRLIALRPSSKMLAVSPNSQAKRTKIFELDRDTGSLRLLATVPYFVQVVAWTPTQFVLGGVPYLPTDIGSPESTIETFTMAGAKVASIKIPTTEETLNRGYVAAGGVEAIDLAADGKTVIVSTWWEDGFGQGVTYGKVAYEYSLANGEKLKTYRVDAGISDIEFDTKDPNRVALVQANTVSIFDVSTGARVAKDEPMNYSSGVTKFDGGILLAYPNRLELRLSDGKTLSTPVLHTMVDALPLPKLGLIVSLDTSGSLLYRSLKTLDPILTVFQGRAGDWIAVSPDGKCESSPHGGAGAYQLIGAQLTPYSQVRSQVETPGLMQKLLTGHS